MAKETNDPKKKWDHPVLNKLLPCCFGPQECTSCGFGHVSSTTEHTTTEDQASTIESQPMNTSERKALKLGKPTTESVKEDRKAGKHRRVFSSSAILLLAAILTLMQGFGIMYTVFYLP